MGILNIMLRLLSYELIYQLRLFMHRDGTSMGVPVEFGKYLCLRFGVVYQRGQWQSWKSLNGRRVMVRAYTGATIDIAVK